MHKMLRCALRGRRVFSGTLRSCNTVARSVCVSRSCAECSLRKIGQASPGPRTAGPHKALRARSTSAAIRDIASCRAMDITYLTAEQATQIDQELMGPLGFSVDQLMELAGLSVACSVASEYPAAQFRKVLVVVGPGNNGGDGLVAGRHLWHFGYDVQVCYPMRTDKPLYHGLVTQLEALHVEFVSGDQVQSEPLRRRCDLVIDAIFGFSFKGDPRPPFDAVLEMMRPRSDPPPVVSVDIPSGWHVERGDADGDGLQPDMLVSLTAPKQGARDFHGRFHYLGGRFVPPVIQEKFQLRLPEYSGVSQCVKIGGASAQEGAGGGAEGESRREQRLDLQGMRAEAAAGRGLLEADMASDPIEQFDRWFREAAAGGFAREPNAVALATVTGEGKPRVRMVLLKGFDARGFDFYTNYDSDKGQELGGNAHAALCFYWEALGRQVRVEGSVARLPVSESDEYFRSRPRGSQIGAAASPQSGVLGSREELEARTRQLEQEYQDEGKPIPRPENWGGFRIAPLAVEFWLGRPSRLRDRLRYRRTSPQDDSWVLERLAP